MNKVVCKLVVVLGLTIGCIVHLQGAERYVLGELWDTNTVYTADGVDEKVAEAGARPSDLLPLMADVAAAGVSNEYARADHIHPAETSVAAYALPDECFPVTCQNAYTHTEYEFLSNDDLQFVYEDNNVQLYSSKYGSSILCNFNAATLKYYGGYSDVTNLRFNGVSPVKYTSPTLRNDAVHVRNVQVAKEADVAAGLAGKLGNSGNQTLNGTLNIQNGQIELYDSGLDSLGLSGKGLLNPNNNTVVNWPSLGNPDTLALVSQVYAAVQQIAPKFSSSDTYAKNALCSYEGVVYQCAVAKTQASATTPPDDLYDASTSPNGHWVAKKVSELFLPLTGGEMTGALSINSLASGEFSFAQGDACAARGYASHAEGGATEAKNSVEHAEGQYNASHQASSSFGDSGNTLSSVGFGIPGTTTTRNATETMQDGKTFIYGLGGYDGTNPTTSGVQDIANAVTTLYDIEGRTDGLYEHIWKSPDPIAHAGRCYGIYFKPSALGMPNGASITSFTLKSDNATAEYLSSAPIFAKIIDPADTSTAKAISYPVVFSTTNTVYNFVLDRAYPLTSSNTEYRIVFYSGAVDGAPYKLIGLSLNNASTSSSDIYIMQVNANNIFVPQTKWIPAMTVNWSVETIEDALALKANDADVLKNSGNQMLNGKLKLTGTSDVNLQIGRDDAPFHLIIDGYGNFTLVDQYGNSTSAYLQNVSGTLALLADMYAAVQQIAPAFEVRDSAHAYAKNDLCSKDGVVYQCTNSSGHSGAWNASNWTAKKVSELFLPLTGGTMGGVLRMNGNAIYLDGGGRVFLDYYGVSSREHTIGWPTASGTLALIQSIAANYSTSATYALNQLCVYNGRLYRCTTAITTAEDWTAAHWTEATVEDVLALKLSTPTELDWASLKAMKDNGLLIPGAEYRITNYIATTVQPGSQSAGHQFDLIVEADSTNKLNETARAIQHAGDTYFNSSNLSAWRLRYCLDNDANRFGWADTTNGKGVIYNMVDEFGNEAPYDFKNMQFLAYGDTDNVYRYTFDSGAASGNTDCSIVQSALVVGNKISDYISSQSYSLGKRYLNSIVFKGVRCHNNVLGPDCRFMTFGTGCCYNTFGTECINNIFGGGCAENTFGRRCSGNRFISDVENTVLGEECIANTIGTYSNGTIFGDRCTGNSIGFDCQGNSFDCDCNDNIIGDSSYYNTFGKCCLRNVLAGGYCEGNSFGSHCAENILLGGNLSNSFGNGCRNNVMGGECNFNTFGNNCCNNTFGSALVIGSFGYDDAYAANVYLSHEGGVYRLTAPYMGEFDNHSSYAVGDYLYRLDAYYRCIQAHSSGVWNENQFEQVTLIGDILSDGTSILGARYEQIIYENGVNCTVLNCTATLGSGEAYRNVTVRSGVQGTSVSAPKVINDANKNQTFNTTYKAANSQEITI